MLQQNQAWNLRGEIENMKKKVKMWDKSMKSKSNYFQQVNAATELSPEYSTTGTISLGETGYFLGIFGVIVWSSGVFMGRSEVGSA